MPKANADDAPTPGDLADEGEAALKGFVLPCDEVSPNLRPENVRGDSTLLPSLPSRSLVGSESLSLVLHPCQCLQTTSVQILTSICESTSWLDPLVLKWKNSR